MNMACEYCDNPGDLPICNEPRGTTVPKSARYQAGIEVTTINRHKNAPPCTRLAGHDQPHVYCYKEAHNAIRWEGAW